jgi:hypothetical protein
MPYGENALPHPDLRWFAYRDMEEHTRFVAVFVGAVFIEADENTENMGIPLMMKGKQKDEKDKKEKEEEEEEGEGGKEEEKDGDDDEKMGEGTLSSDIKDAATPSIVSYPDIRETYLNDISQSLVIEWEQFQSSMYSTYDNIFEYCRRRNAFARTAKLDKFWGQRADDDDEVMNGDEQKGDADRDGSHIQTAVYFT